ncbi:hypothetical protein BGZ88_007545, partial [Linnemannia elongata]
PLERFDVVRDVNHYSDLDGCSDGFYGRLYDDFCWWDVEGFSCAIPSTPQSLQP